MPRTLSPLSIPYRVFQRGGGIAVAVAVAASGGFEIPGVGSAGPLLLFGVAGIAILALLGYETAYVRRFTYELDGDTLDIESGVLSRRSREIPIRRIQNVDISRNVVQRLLGIAVVSFETAGGGDTEATLRFVSFEEAKRLQRTLGRLKRSEAVTEGSEAAADATERSARESTDSDLAGDATSRNRFAAPEVTELFALERGELALVGALSIDFRVPGILFLIASTVGSTVLPAYLTTVPGVALAASTVLVVAAVAFLSWVVGAARAIVEYYDFRLVRAGDELQYERGLLQRYDGSIPFDKVQTLTVSDNPLKRYFGYATLYIETAGYAPGGSSGGSRGSEAAIPLAERDRVLELVEELEPVGDVDFRRPPKRARRRYVVRYLLVVVAFAGVIVGVNAVFGVSLPWWPPLLLVPLAIAFAHLAWKHRGHWLGEHHVVTRNGVLRRQTKIVPYYRIQTVIDSRTVFQRRLDLATVTIDTAGSLSLGGQDAAAVDVSGERADELRDELETRLDSAVDAYRAGRAGIGVDDEYGPERDDEGDSDLGSNDSDGGGSDSPGDGTDTADARKRTDPDDPYNPDDPDDQNDPDD